MADMTDLTMLLVKRVVMPMANRLCAHNADAQYQRYSKKYSR